MIWFFEVFGLRISGSDKPEFSKNFHFPDIMRNLVEIMKHPSLGFPNF